MVFFFLHLASFATAGPPHPGSPSLSAAVGAEELKRCGGANRRARPAHRRVGVRPETEHTSHLFLTPPALELSGLLLGQDWFPPGSAAAVREVPWWGAGCPHQFTHTHTPSTPQKLVGTSGGPPGRSGTPSSNASTSGLGVTGRVTMGWRSQGARGAAGTRAHPGDTGAQRMLGDMGPWGHREQGQDKARWKGNVGASCLQTWVPPSQPCLCTPGSAPGQGALPEPPPPPVAAQHAPARAATRTTAAWESGEAPAARLYGMAW